MGLRVDGKATVWEITAYEKYTDVKLSTSKKNKQTDAWETDFSAKVRFVADAHKKAGCLAEKDKIKLKSLEVSAKWNAEKKALDTRFVTYDFVKVDADGNEIAVSESAAAPKNTVATDADGFMAIPDGIGEELPFA